MIDGKEGIGCLCWEADFGGLPRCLGWVCCDCGCVCGDTLDLVLGEKSRNDDTLYFSL